MSSDAKSLPLTISGVTKSYGSLKALDNVSIDVKSGEFVTLLGPSGSGKTTLLMVLAGFVRPDSGSVKFGDEEVIRKPPHKRGVGMVFQNYALFPHMNVLNNVAFPLKLRRVAQDEIAERVQGALDLVQLGDLGQRRIDQLSGGQRQRVALARAIIFDPQILLMDEPLSALDKKLREHMQIEIRHLHEKLGRTTVYVTHDQREALTMSDRVAVIDFGQFKQIDAPKDLYERPRSKFVADFIGESSFLPVEVNGSSIDLDGATMRLAEPPISSDKRQLLVVRPEKLELLADGGGQNLNTLVGTVKELVYQRRILPVLRRPVWRYRNRRAQPESQRGARRGSRSRRADSSRPASSGHDRRAGRPMTAITTDQVAAVPVSRENAEGLTRDAKREHQSVFALCSPSLFLVLLILFLPVGWLMWLSFFDVQGNWTLENYARMFRLEVLHQDFPHDLRDQLRRHRHLHPDGLSARLYVVATRQTRGGHLHDLRAVAVLDLAARAHLCLARPTAAQRGDQRLADRDGHHRRTAPAGAQLHRHGDRHGANPAALPRAAALCRDEVDRS